jgi:2-polyprenyl-6-methoxyphenol hydroxylase-like FAD-dependent oxidoreductase
MGLHWGVPILKSLLPDESAANLQTVQVDPNTPTKPIDILQFLNGSDGTVLSAPEIPNFYRLRRSQLRALMARGLDIRFGKKLVHIVYEHDGKHATAEFDDGSKESGVLIIGVDGARSRVRSLLLGPDKAANERLTYSASFIQAKFTREQALFLRSFHPLYIAAPHPQGTFAFFGLQDAPETDVPEGWTFFFYISWNSSFEQQDKERKEMGNKERLEQVRKLSQSYCDPWKSAFAWVEDDQAVWNMDLSVWDPSLDEHKWDSRGGRVTLVGDAAHPMTYRVFSLLMLE